MTPTTLAMALIVGGTGLAVAGQIQQSQAAKAAKKDAANISEYNARVAEQEGKAARLKSEAEADKQQRAGAALQAEQQVQFGKAGVTGRGSPLTVKTQTAKELELDRQMLIREGFEAEKFAQSKAAGSRLQASSYRTQAKNIGRAGILSATGTAIGGFGKLV